MDCNSESKLFSFITQITRLESSSDSKSKRESELLSILTQMIPLVSSMDFRSMPEQQSEFMSLVTQIISVLRSVLVLEPVSRLSSLVTEILSLLGSVTLDWEQKPESKLMSLLGDILSLTPEPELVSLIRQMMTLVISKNSNPELKLTSLITSCVFVFPYIEQGWASDFKSLVAQVILLVISMDLETLPKPDSEFISLITRIKSLYDSLSKSEPESELVSLITQIMCLVVSTNSDSDSEIISLVNQLFSMEPEPELISYIKQVMSLVRSMNPDPKEVIFLCPQVKVQLEEGRFRVVGNVQHRSNQERGCFCSNTDFYKITTGDSTVHYHCQTCNGKFHEEYNKAPLKVNHPLHSVHSLQLVLMSSKSRTRKCYCCVEDLKEIFYYCSTCDFAMNIACVERPPVLSVLFRDHPKLHEHTLVLFPRQTSLTCNLCASTHSSCPFYMCPPCDFVVHESCINLPRVIRISRHPHRVSFTPSFKQGDHFCGVCCVRVNSDYGGYSCIKNGCSFVAHSACATQSNVWDGKEFDGEPEEIEEEEVGQFLRISDGVILHFSNEYYQMRLDESWRDYDGNKDCQACIRPIYFGNFYSCLQCDFSLHESCTHLSRNIYHPLHPHVLTLVATNHVGEIQGSDSCSACVSLLNGFFYECGKEECCFKLDVHCATIVEPLYHASHKHPLFLTSKPRERRICCVCKDVCIASTEAYREALSCVLCNFDLCFRCATIPEEVRYKHDKHVVTLSYGEETSIMTYWCEVCEGAINPKERFYKCDENCCVTIHMECLVGQIFKMKPGLLLIYTTLMGVNSFLLSQSWGRDICVECHKRCQFRSAFRVRYRAGYFCSIPCVFRRFPSLL